MSDGTAAVIHRAGSRLHRGLSALPTPAQRCLILAAVGPSGRIEDRLREWRSLVDLRGPIDGGSYRLLPTVFHRLQAAGLDDVNRNLFKGVYRRSVIENAQVIDAALPALRALGSAGLRPWLMKGAALLSAGYYPTQASRPMSDVDVVVTSAQRSEAVAVLRSLGYAPRLSDREMSAFNSAAFVNRDGVEFDLHWHFLNHVRSASADELITRTFQEVELNGASAWVPGAGGLLITTVLHGTIPNPEPSIRWLVDASMILRLHGHEIEWNDVVEFATEFRIARRLEQGLSLITEYTDETVPDATLTALRAIPTTPVERLEKGLATAPWNSMRGRFIQLFAGFAGGNRELRHVTTAFPRYLSHRWNVGRLDQLPRAGVQKLTRSTRSGER